jgi:hypothetical protein
VVVWIRRKRRVLHLSLSLLPARAVHCVARARSCPRSMQICSIFWVDPRASSVAFRRIHNFMARTSTARRPYTTRPLDFSATSTSCRGSSLSQTMLLCFERHRLDEFRLCFSTSSIGSAGRHIAAGFLDPGWLFT